GDTSLPEEPDVAQACHSCIVDHACDPSRTCGTSGDCQALEWCVFECRTNDCRNACRSARAPAFSQFASLFSVLGNDCTVCNRDGYWECVGNFTWPIAKSDTINAVMTSTDSSTRSVPGLTVKACTSADRDCASPIASGTTD